MACQNTAERCSSSSPITHSSVRWESRGGGGKILWWVHARPRGCQKASANEPPQLGWGLTSSNPMLPPNTQSQPWNTRTPLWSWAGGEETAAFSPRQCKDQRFLSAQLTGTIVICCKSRVSKRHMVRTKGHTFPRFAKYVGSWRSGQKQLRISPG